MASGRLAGRGVSRAAFPEISRCFLKNRQALRVLASKI
ncbi:ABC transporter ATP-binding protein [Cronobacter sakazakii]|nr:ABC transporter ATP-binding protein [Cronobacter sakazakii]EGT5763304.1 ABC transporter ATP-binding protein [Cronobacter sakazakii]EGT5766648.1 ABC transporter ATP-binding protein [Cronobacter sakazakii]KAB0840907.1 ABC transporter ATP-binding protein [Cronobacter sakazakii]KAB0847386.1 ABC transporter ATP-binding protein [Cronobacter sakazakii]